MTTVSALLLHDLRWLVTPGIEGKCRRGWLRVSAISDFIEELPLERFRLARQSKRERASRNRLTSSSAPSIQDLPSRFSGGRFAVLLLRASRIHTLGAA